MFLWLVTIPSFTRMTGPGGIFSVTLPTEAHIHRTVHRRETASEQTPTCRPTWEPPNKAPRTGDAVTTLQRRPSFLQQESRLMTRILTQAFSRIALYRVDAWKRVSSNL